MSNLGFEGWNWVLIVPVPDHCIYILLFTELRAIMQTYYLYEALQKYMFCDHGNSSFYAIL